MSGGNDFMKNGYEQISMRTGENRNVHGHSGRVGFIQAYAKVPFAGQQQQYEYADVHQADSSCFLFV